MGRIFSAALMIFAGGWMMLLIGTYLNDSSEGGGAEHEAAKKAFGEAVDLAVELAQNDVEAYRSGLRRTRADFFKNHYSVPGSFDLTPEIEALGVQKLELKCTFAAEPILASFSGQIEMGGATHRMRGFDLPISKVSAVCDPMSIQRYPDHQSAVD